MQKSGGVNLSSWIWSPHNEFLYACGSSAGASLWDTRKDKVLVTFDTGPTKAICWDSLESGILYIGLSRYDIYKPTLLNRIVSPVTSLHHLESTSELVGTRGTDIEIRDSRTLDLKFTLCGHHDRIINSCLSPNNDTLITLGCDETLRFWNLAYTKPTRKRINDYKISQTWHTCLR